MDLWGILVPKGVKCGDLLHQKLSQSGLFLHSTERDVSHSQDCHEPTGNRRECSQDDTLTTKDFRSLHLNFIIVGGSTRSRLLEVNSHLAIVRIHLEIHMTDDYSIIE